MEKVTLPSFNKKVVDDFIKEIQAFYPSEDININNVNDFSLMHDEKINCQKCRCLAECKNSQPGHCLSRQNGDFVAVECRYRKAESQKHDLLIQTLYLPEQVMDVSLDKFDCKCDSRAKIYKHIVEYGLHKEDDFQKGYYLYGKSSIGKTYSLAVIANELSKRNIKCLLIYFPDLVLDLKNAIGTSRFESLINMLKSIDILMLDDLGMENLTPWIRDEILGPVINYRMLTKMPLYVSTNLNPTEMQEHLSIDNSLDGKNKAKRITSRMTSLMKILDMDDSQTYKR